MKFTFLFVLVFLFSCSGPITGEKRVYICGDRTCENNKEVKDYFNNNISIEVYTITSDKDMQKNFDLVELNLLKEKLESKEKIQISDKKKKINKQIKERKKLAKLKMKKVEKSFKVKEITKKKEILKKKKSTQFTIVRICKNLQECDIDKISKIVMDIGKKKDYPDITN
tara:strand:- start:1558 stop:2064 length:507 start_codon:yes stop_codon:yes gene_type:complete